YFANSNYWFVALLAVLSLLSYISRAYLWNFMLQLLVNHTKLANNFIAISVDYFMNVFIPKSGKVTREIILDKYEGVPFQKGFGTIISERIVDLIFLMFFTALALTIKFDALYLYIVESVPPSLLYLLMVGIVCVAICILVYIRYSKSNINKKLKNFIVGLKDGVFSIVKMKKKLP